MLIHYQIYCRHVLFLCHAPSTYWEIAAWNIFKHTGTNLWVRLVYRKYMETYYGTIRVLDSNSNCMMVVFVDRERDESSCQTYTPHSCLNCFLQLWFQAKFITWCQLWTLTYLLWPWPGINRKTCTWLMEMWCLMTFVSNHVEGKGTIVKRL